MDRQDIDALLVGALYGELTPADEARLTAHLESHPADRGALDDLKSARAKVRESRIFSLQAEPPQHISALLLQEAHRRAPKKVIADDGERKDSWFWRFARSFALHPAMAAAAMLVVVLGVSALVYKNKGADFANREVSAPSATQSKSGDTAEMSPTTIPPAVDQSAVVNQGAAAGSAAPSDSYHAGLADREDLQNDPGMAEGAAGNTKATDNSESASQRWRNETDGKVAAPSKNKGIVVTTEQPQPKDLDGARDEDRRADAAKLAKEQQQTARKADSNSAALDFGGAAGGDDGYAAPAPTTGSAPGRGAGTGGGASNGLAVGGLAPATTAPAAPKGNAAGPTATPTTPPANHVYAQPPPPPPSAADKSTTATVTTSKPEPARQAPVKQEAKPDAKAAPAKTAGATAPSGATATGAKSGASTTTSDTKKVATQKPPADKPAEEKAEKAPPPKAVTKSPVPPQQQPAAPPADPTVAWAKGQHATAVKLAKSGDCKGAANVALGVSQKAPAYYASFMASDRELKSCKQYIDDARDREAEKSAKSRAQKRVNADEPAAPAENAK